MKKRYWLSASILALILFISAGSAVAVMAKTQEQGEAPLAGKVLQKNDLPGSEGYYAGEVPDDRFPGPPNFGNIPMEAEGLLQAYEVNAFLPLNNDQSVVFVMNLAYQYQDRAQVEAAFEQWINFLDQVELPANANEEAVDHLESLAAANRMHGRALRYTYPSEGTTWQTHYFLGVKDEILVFLMIDGLPSAAAQEKFDALATILIGR